MNEKAEEEGRVFGCLHCMQTTSELRDTVSGEKSPTTKERSFNLELKVENPSK